MNIHIHAKELHLHLPGDALNSVHSKLDLIIKNQNSIMQTLEDLKAAVAVEDSVIDSAVTLIQGMAEQIAALTPDQAAIDALATDVKNKADALAAAVAANTPASTETPPQG